MKKKIIAVLLSACMLVSACPTGAFAMSDEEQTPTLQQGMLWQGERRPLTTPAPEETEAPEQTLHSRSGGDTHSRPGRDPGSC